MVGLALILLIPLLISLLIPLFRTIFTPNTENDGRKRSDPYTIYDGMYMRSYHPCLEDGNEVWFEYVSEEDVKGGDKVYSDFDEDENRRRFYITGIDCDYEMSVYVGKKKDVVASSVNDDVTVDLVEGKKLYICVKLTDDIDTSWTLNIGEPLLEGEQRESAYDLALGTNAARTYESLEDSSTVWFKFMPPKAGYYSFTATGISGDYSFNVYRGDSSYTESSNGGYYYLYSSEPCYVQFHSYDADTFGMNVELAKGDSMSNAIVLNEGANATGYISGVHSSSYMYFEFTPAESGWYSFYTDDCYYPYLYIYDDVNDSDSDYLTYVTYTNWDSATLNYNLTAGTTYYLRLYFYNSTDSEYTMNVGKIAAGTTMSSAYPLTSGSNATQNYDSLANGSEVWFSFTPDSTGYYRFTLTDASENYSYTVYNSSSSSLSASSGYYNLYSGSTYYAKFTGIYDNDDFGITIETAKGNSFDNAIELEAGVDKNTGYISGVHSSYRMYFEFTPSTGGVYRFEAKNANSHYLRLYDSYQSSLTSTSMGNYALDYSLTAGETYYVVVDFNSSYYCDSDYTMTVNTVAAGGAMGNAYPLTLGSNATQNYDSLANGSDVWFSFTPDSTGYYRFRLTDASENYSYTVYNSSSSSVSASSGYYYLSSGYTYYAKFTGISDNDDFGVNVETAKGDSMSNAIVLNEGANDTGYISGVHSSYKMYFEFTPAESGWYSFYTNNANSHYLYLYDDNYSSLNSTSFGSYSINHQLTAGETYYVLVDFYSSSYTDSSYQIIAMMNPDGYMKENAIEIELGENEAEAWESLENNSYVWFKFTPEITSFYTFVLSTDVGSITYPDSVHQVYSGDAVSNYNTVSYSSIASGTVGYKLTAGYVYYLLYYPTEDEFGVNVSQINAGITPDDAQVLTAGDVLNAGYNSSVNISGENWFSFTPTSNGYYTFSVSDGSRRSMYLYMGIDNAKSYNAEYGFGSTSDSGSSSSYYLYSGNTYYFLVDAYSSSYYDTNYYVSVRETEYGTTSDPIDLVLGGAINAGYNSSYNTNYSVWFEFTPEESGYYNINSYNASRRYLYLYTAAEAQNYWNGYSASPMVSTSSYTTNSSYSFEQYLDGGETYYYLVQFYSSSYTDSNFDVSVTRTYHGSRPEDAYTLTSSSYYAGYNSSYNSNSEMWFKFTPTEDGAYMFYSTDAYYAYLYLYEDVSDVNSGYLTYASYTSTYNVSLAYELTAGTTYYVRIYFSSGTDSSYYMNVKSAEGSSLDYAYEINVGDTLTASITTGGQYIYYVFTAEEAGTYSFYSTGGYDTYGYLYDSNHDQIASNDDGAGSGGFLMTKSMEVGETVYIGARMYSSSNTGTFYVNVTKG